MSKKQTQVVGKIQRAFELYNEVDAQGNRKYSVESIAEALGISPRTVRGYVYRIRHPEEYKALVQRYFAKKRGEAPAAAPNKPLHKLSKAQLIKMIKAAATPKAKPVKRQTAKPAKQIVAELKPKPAAKPKKVKAPKQAAAEPAQAPAEAPAEKPAKKSRAKKPKA